MSRCARLFFFFFFFFFFAVGFGALPLATRVNTDGSMHTTSFIYIDIPVRPLQCKVVVGGGANDGIAEMKVRLKRLIQQEIDDGKHAEEVADYE